MLKVSRIGWKKTDRIYDHDETVSLVKYLDDQNTENKKIYELNKHDINHNSIKKSIKLFFDEIYNDAEYEDVHLSKVWYVKTTFQNSEPGKLPYIPHFDKRRFVKLMIYLNDVTAHDGPFTTASHPVEFYDSKRLNLPSNYKDLGLNSDLSEHNYESLTFLAGQGVIFDTNCAHYAHPVDKGGKRIALRLDFEDHNWNVRFESPLGKLKSWLSLK